ncbi:MAG TPA: polysaccharide deacetylase family protein [Longimicrobiales bacterium]|nr:polysaccharide deacetylase family protein [Longimicrobiales bacterium]
MSAAVARNILSVDLEDWHGLVLRRIRGGPLPAPSRHVFRQTDGLLAMLERHGVKCTFFVLGALAEAAPELVARVAAAGHEIGSHGHGHDLVFRLGAAAFREDVKRAKGALEDMTGREVAGYRAPEFSISRPESLPWALEILADLGFRYDSSIFPIRGRRYGLAGFPREPACYEMGAAGRLVEFPLATYHAAGRDLPVAGGGYFRLFPLRMLDAAVRSSNAAGLPFVTYFHPYEFDAEPLDVYDGDAARGWQERLSGARYNARYNVGRPGLARKVEALLERHHFTTFAEYLDHAAVSTGCRVFPSHG